MLYKKYLLKHVISNVTIRTCYLGKKIFSMIKNIDYEKSLKLFYLNGHRS